MALTARKYSLQRSIRRGWQCAWRSPQSPKVWAVLPWGQAASGNILVVLVNEVIFPNTPNFLSLSFPHFKAIAITLP